ncbi:chromatin modification-related protein EAF6, partial [Tremellales sp. Uapishka_1]
MSLSGPPADAKQAQMAAHQELEAALKKKRAIDSSLANIEASIYAFEGSYLEDTAASGGNIIKGFDNYLKPPASNVNKKKLEVSESDRLFSTSSGTYQQYHPMLPVSTAVLPASAASAFGFSNNLDISLRTPAQAFVPFGQMNPPPFPPPVPSISTVIALVTEGPPAEEAIDPAALMEEYIDQSASPSDSSQTKREKKGSQTKLSSRKPFVVTGKKAKKATE